VKQHSIAYSEVKKKAKAATLHATKALEWRGIAPTHSRSWHYMGVSGQHHALAAL
jgi:hypothetical protein